MTDMSNRISTPQDLLFSSIICFKSLFDNWARIIEKYQGTDGASFRRNAVCIWLNALIEYWRKKKERDQCLANLRKNSPDLSKVETTLVVFDEFILNVLNEFTIDEQVAFWYLRNSVLHGHLTLHFKDDMKVSVFDPVTQKVIKVQKTRQEFENAVDSISGNPTERVRALKEFKHLLENYDLYLQHRAVDQYHEVLFGHKVSST